MDISSLNGTVGLVKDLFDAKVPTSASVNFKDRKPEFVFNGIKQPFMRTTPEAVGISSRHIINFLSELKNDKTLRMHNVIILRNGKIICEATFGNSDLHIWKMTFSACKSIVSLAIGMLIDDGKLTLSDKLLDIFPEYNSAVLKIKLRDITVENLLNMTSCLAFNEFACMVTNDWEKAFLKSAIVGKSGEDFNYNSLNTYMLAAVVKKITGSTVTEFLTPRLFKPLGIDNFYWEKAPSGVEKGGWGLYMLPEDFAKIGQLVMQNGVWNDERIVSQDWVRNATSKQVSTPENCGDFNYGYQFWVGRSDDKFLLNGMMGQNVLGYRENGVLIITNAGNDEMFQQSNYFRIAQKYFGQEFEPYLSNNDADYEELCNFIAGLKHKGREKPGFFARLFSSKVRPDILYFCENLNGRVFTTVDKNAASVGFLPLMLQAIQNNYTKGFKSISFNMNRNDLYMNYAEEGLSLTVPLGTSGFIKSKINYNGENYIISSNAILSSDEDENKVIIISVDFLETFSSRKIKVYFKEDKIILKQIEIPGADFITAGINSAKNNFTGSKFLANAISKIEDDYIKYKCNSVFAPEIKLK